MFIPDKPFQPSLMFAVKARILPLKGKLLASLTNIRIS